MRALTLSALVMLAACEGSVVGGSLFNPKGPQLPPGSNPTDPNNPNNPPEQLPGPRFSCSDPLKRGTTLKKLRRLSRLELTQTLDDLVGANITADNAISMALTGLPDDHLEQLSTISDGVPPLWANTLSTVSRRAVNLLLANPTERTRALGACTTASPLQAACIRDVIATFGARVWRRNLETDEADELFAFYTATGGGDAGLSFLLRRLLQSPALVFHLEDRGADQGSGRIRLTPFEVAARLSYATTGSMPDALLSEAARTGKLATLDEVRSHAARLLDTPRGRARVRDFFRYYMHLGAVADPFRPAALKDGLDEKGLGAELAAEALDFSEQIFWRPTNGGFADLMTAGIAVPKSTRLAKIFGAQCASQTTQDFAPDDAAVFWHADGSTRGPAPAQLTQNGWFVWDLPAGRLSQAATRLDVELVATSSDGTPLDLALNLNDVPMVGSFSAAAGTRTITTAVTLAAGASAKVGIYFKNAAAGRTLTFKKLTFVGAPPSNGGCGQLVQTATHPGLLHRPALLAGPLDRTSPILRGAHVRKRFLCRDLPTPDAALVTARMEAVGDLSQKPNRERVTTLTGDAQCTGCHALINPLGFSFEKFDQAGMLRTEEQLWDAAGMAGATHAIDTKVEAPKLDPTGGPATLADSLELSAAMAQSPTAAACFTQRAFEYYRTAAVDLAADGCALANAEAKAKSGSLQDVVLELIATDDLFYRGAP